MANKEKTLRVALVGCGQIADAHLQEIAKVRNGHVVAVCDRHIALARQASARFGVPAAYTDLNQMLAEVRPDVLHVTTPPHTHAPISISAMKAGVHVYIEKPFAVTLAETDAILQTADTCGRYVCVGHDQLYDPAWTELRELHTRGELGDIVHVDAIQGYDLGGPFGQTIGAGHDHWIHQLPGGLFQNTMSHPVYRITEFLTDEEPEVWATWFGTGETIDYPTELRAMLKGKKVTANLVFTSRSRPVQRITRVYGTRQTVEVDLDGRVLRVARPRVLPGPFAKIEAPYRHLREAARGLGKNIIRFLRSDLHYFTGMKRLIEQFYDSILTNGAPPIPYAEIRRVTAVMDQIIQRCRENDFCRARSPSIAEAQPADHSQLQNQESGCR